MTKILLAFLAAALATIVAVGCGGGRSDADRIIARIQTLLADANREDLNATMTNYSFDYCDDVDFCSGGTYVDERDCWQSTYTDPQTYVRFSNLRVLIVEVNEQLGQGYIDAIVYFEVFDQFGTFLGSDDYSFRMWMIEEDGRWVMWGDGQCFDSPMKGVQKWKDRIGKETKTGSPATRKK